MIARIVLLGLAAVIVAAMLAPAVRALPPVEQAAPERILTTPLPEQAAVCAPREVTLAQLAGKYAEAPAVRWLALNGGVVELLASPDGETWSLLITMPDGMACLIAAGELWQPLSTKLGREM